MPFFKIKIVWKLIIKNNIFILELFHQNFESHLACLCLLFFGWQLAHHLHCPFFKNPEVFLYSSSHRRGRIWATQAHRFRLRQPIFRQNARCIRNRILRSLNVRCLLPKQNKNGSRSAHQTWRGKLQCYFLVILSP